MLGSGVNPPAKEVLKELYTQLVARVISKGPKFTRCYAFPENKVGAITGKMFDLRLSFYDLEDSSDCLFQVDKEGTLFTDNTNCPETDTVLDLVSELLKKVTEQNTAPRYINVGGAPKMDGVKELYAQIMEKLNWNETHDSQRFYLEDKLRVTAKENPQGEVEFTFGDFGGYRSEKEILFTVIGKGGAVIYTPDSRMALNPLIVIESMQKFLTFLLTKTEGTENDSHRATS